MARYSTFQILLRSTLPACGLLALPACSSEEFGEGEEGGDSSPTEGEFPQDETPSDGSDGAGSSTHWVGSGGNPSAAGGSNDGEGGASTGGSTSDAPYCEPTLAWDAERSQLEQAILEIVNQKRAEGAKCGGQTMPPTGPLAMDPALQCAARMHSLDMATRSYFSHDSPEGEGPGGRVARAGYEGGGWGENIAAGNPTAEATMEQWMSSPPHCANLMDASFSLIGVGYYLGGQLGHMWTQTFGND